MILFYFIKSLYIATYVSNDGVHTSKTDFALGQGSGVKFFFRHQQPPTPLALLPGPAVVSDRVRKLICQRLGGLRKLEDSDAKFASEPG